MGAKLWLHGAGAHLGMKDSHPSSHWDADLGEIGKLDFAQTCVQNVTCGIPRNREIPLRDVYRRIHLQRPKSLGAAWTPGVVPRE